MTSTEYDRTLSGLESVLFWVYAYPAFLRYAANTILGGLITLAFLLAPNGATLRQ
jgi:hypothetical protein